MQDIRAYRPRRSLRKLLYNDWKRHKWKYILVIPVILFFLLFHYKPMYGILIAFKKYKPNRGIWGSDWVGLQYFERLFSSAMFFRVFRNTLLLNIYSVIFGFPAPILLALLLNEIRNLKYKRLVQSIVYIPHFFSWVVLAGMIQNILSPSHGIVNVFIKFITGMEEGIYFLADERWWRTMFVISGIWKEIGWGTIIYLAAITGSDHRWRGQIPPDHQHHVALHCAHHRDPVDFAHGQHDGRGHGARIALVQQRGARCGGRVLHLRVPARRAENAVFAHHGHGLVPVGGIRDPAFEHQRHRQVDQWRGHLVRA